MLVVKYLNNINYIESQDEENECYYHVGPYVEGDDIAYKNSIL